MNHPLWITEDQTFYADQRHPHCAEVARLLATIAELQQASELLYRYRITAHSLWEAAAAGWQATSICTALAEYLANPLPEALTEFIYEQVAHYGKLRLVTQDGKLLLGADDPALLDRLFRLRRVAPFLAARSSDTTVEIAPEHRGLLKQALIQAGYPLLDQAGFLAGTALSLALQRLKLRDYQQRAVEKFVGVGAGVVVLPCGSGKTIVRLGAIATLATRTLIVCPNTTAVRQWIELLRSYTDLPAEQIGEYSGERKQICPITVATYQVLTYRDGEQHPHLALIETGDWGLIIYDEVHMLPAPVFRATAAIQARRRLGLTATLVREDGREGEVFALIGPRCYEAPWRELEQRGYIASARCIEIRVPFAEAQRRAYVFAENRRSAQRIAAENPAKLDALANIIAQHPHAQILVIGQYLEQLAADDGAKQLFHELKSNHPERLSSLLFSRNIFTRPNADFLTSGEKRELLDRPFKNDQALKIVTRRLTRLRNRDASY